MFNALFAHKQDLLQPILKLAATSFSTILAFCKKASIRTFIFIALTTSCSFWDCRATCQSGTLRGALALQALQQLRAAGSPAGLQQLLSLHGQPVARSQHKVWLLLHLALCQHARAAPALLFAAAALTQQLLRLLLFCPPRRAAPSHPPLLAAALARSLHLPWSPSATCCAAATRPQRARGRAAAWAPFRVVTAAPLTVRPALAWAGSALPRVMATAVRATAVSLTAVPRTARLLEVMQRAPRPRSTATRTAQPPWARILRARKPKLLPYDHHVLLPMRLCIFGCGAMVFHEVGAVRCSSGKHILGPIDQAYRATLELEHKAADSRHAALRTWPPPAAAHKQ